MTHFIPTPGEKALPCEIIDRYSGKRLLVSVLDDRKPNGKRDFTNTDTHGCTLLIDEKQLLKLT